MNRFMRRLLAFNILFSVIFYIFIVTILVGVWDSSASLIVYFHLSLMTLVFSILWIVFFSRLKDRR